VIVSSGKTNVPGYQAGNWGCHTMAPPLILVEQVRAEMEQRTKLPARDITRATSKLYVVAWDGPTERTADDVVRDANEPPGRPTPTPEDQEATLLAWVLEQTAGVTGGDVRAHGHFARQRFANAANAEVWLDGLVQQGLGRWVNPAEVTRPGRPPARRFIPGAEPAQGALPGMEDPSPSAQGL
jgi:hypothetical protein